MLFNINKKTSIALMQITGALSLLFIPAFLNMLSLEASVYCLATVFMFVATLRIKENSKVSFSMQHLIYAVLIAFGILSILWSKNTSGHFLYIFSLVVVLAYSIILKDYFAENNSNGFKRRLAYLVSVSGVLCAGVNIVHWIVYIVPVAGNDAFRQGMATADLLGIFMVLSIACTISLFKNNSKIKKALFVVSVFVMLFVFIMTQSTIAWIFAAVFIALIVVKRKTKNTKNYILFSSGFVILYFIAIILKLTNTLEGKAFSDVFKYSFENIFGAGGGFWNGRETFSHFNYEGVCGVGLFPYLTATAGLVGIISCVLLLARNIIVFVRQKTTESTVNLLIFLTILILPFGNSISGILLLTGLTVYNESMTDAGFKIPVKASVVKKATTYISVIVILSAFMTVLSFLKMAAYSEFSKGEYNKSYELYKMVAKINFTDSESCKMAALSIYRDETLLDKKKGEAISLIDKAIKGDKLNLGNYELKAKIYYSSQEYELCAQEYRNISSKSTINDKYNLSLAKALYKIVEENPKGSSETKRAYEEIVAIAQTTDNLDLRKEINDIADKAFVYTKGDLNNEREEMAQ